MVQRNIMLVAICVGQSGVNVAEEMTSAEAANLRLTFAFMIDGNIVGTSGHLGV